MEVTLKGISLRKREIRSRIDPCSINQRSSLTPNRNQLRNLSVNLPLRVRKLKNPQKSQNHRKRPRLGLKSKALNPRPPGPKNL